MSKSLEDMELSPEDQVMICQYTGLRSFIKKESREKLSEFLNAIDLFKFNYNKFISNHRYKNMNDRDFVWSILRSVAEFREESNAIRIIEKLKAYEERNNIDLYELFPGGV